MALFTVEGLLTVSVHTRVEAKTAEEAVAKAQAVELPGLCWQCSSNDAEGQWSLSGELDGEPTDLEAEPAELGKKGKR